jgi:MtaA/CmuA family methyltransferase
MGFAAARAGISYREYATNGAALASAQLAAQERFGLDAITSCSDAFRISADLGGDMSYPESTPPRLNRPIVRSSRDVDTLGRPDPTASGSRQADRVAAVAEMARAAAGRVAVLGWVDMPFAEAASVCGVTEFLLMTVDDPEAAHRLLAHLTGIVVQFALAQVEAGADMIGAGDAAASLVSPRTYSEFALPYEQEVVRAVHAAGIPVKLHICGNTSRLLKLMISTEADLFNVDHLVPFELARDTYSAAQKCFKGNLDPVARVLQATPQDCGAAARECIALAAGSRYMLSAGCEIPAETPDETFLRFCAASSTAASSATQATGATPTSGD